MIICGQTRGLLSSNDQLALELQFAADKSYSINPNNPAGFLINSRVGPPATFSRASGATEIDSAGRIVYANENLGFYTNEIILNRGWALGAITSTLSGSTPLGGNAYIIAETTANELHNCGCYGSSTNQNGLAVTIGIVFTASIFVKKITDSIDWIQLTMGGAGFGLSQYANFNIANGTVGNTSGLATGTTATIEPYSDGWYRISMSAPAIITGTSFGFSLGFINNTNGTSRLPTYIGNPANRVLAAMGQIQKGTTARPYILTTSAIRHAPRFIYTPATGKSLGLLPEGSRTNLIRQSETLGTTWTQTFITVSSDVEVAPSGETTADKVVEDATDGAHGVAQNITYTAVAHTFSVYAKAAERNWIRIGFGNAGADNVWFDLVNGVTGVIAAGFTASMQNAGNGWWRCIVTRTPTAGSLSTYIRIATGDTVISYQGDNSSGVYIWGAQVEAGANFSSYIPTTTISVVRSADVCRIAGTDFADMYNQNEGTVFCAFRTAGILNARNGVYGITASNRQLANIEAVMGTNTSLTLAVASSPPNFATQALFSQTVIPLRLFKSAIAVKTDDFAGSVGGSIQTDNLGQLNPIMDRFVIGATGDTSGPSAGFNTFESIRYYRRRLPNPKLQALTLTDEAEEYIDAVEEADGALLEDGVKQAYRNFIYGCKADGIWDSIKSSCIMAGARTFRGAIIPLKGSSPTNFNFISTDYDRKTGLKGNGSTKYLSSNRNNNADPRDNRHKSVYVTTAPSVDGGFIGAGLTNSGSDHIARVSTIIARSVNSSFDSHTQPISSTGLMGINRNLSSSFEFRVNSITLSFSRISQTALNQTSVVFGRNGVPQSDARLSFYSIGESLNLDLLDSRVTTLMAELSAAIP